MKLRVPLRTNVSANDVDNAFTDNGWPVDRAVVDDVGDPIFKRWHAGEATTVHYIRDSNVGVDYILVAGERAADTARAVHRQLSSWSTEDILAYAEWASVREDLVIVLHLIGLIGGDEFDAALYRHLERGATHGDPEVRRAAMLAASYLRWPEVATMVLGVFRADPAHEVRSAASAVLPPDVVKLDGPG